MPCLLCLSKDSCAGGRTQSALSQELTFYLGKALLLLSVLMRPHTFEGENKMLLNKVYVFLGKTNVSTEAITNFVK